MQNELPDILAITGQSGSGKSTSLKILLHLYKSNNIKTLFIETGDIIKKYKDSGNTELINNIRKLYNNGKLIPGTITEALITQEIFSKYKKGDKIIISGTPLRVSQCLYLKRFIDDSIFKSLKIIGIEATKETCFNRLIERTIKERRIDTSVEGKAGEPDLIKIENKLDSWTKEEYEIINFCKIHDMYLPISNNSNNIEFLQQKIEEIFTKKQYP